MPPGGARQGRAGGRRIGVAPGGGQGPRRGAATGVTPGGREGGGREEERGREGELTSRLNDRRQPLIGIPPRARGGGGRWKREREGSCCAEKRNERERGHMGEKGARGTPRPAQGGPRHGPSRADNPQLALAYL
jgi:hypothetical protein